MGICSVFMLIFRFAFKTLWLSGSGSLSLACSRPLHTQPNAHTHTHILAAVAAKLLFLHTFCIPNELRDALDNVHIHHGPCPSLSMLRIYKYAYIAYTLSHCRRCRRRRRPDRPVRVRLFHIILHRQLSDFTHTHILQPTRE